ncbi:MAG: DUF47 family protein [Clostridia bacterium]|nr:DUF47 family protein [Clostridia bacterium]
MKKIEIIKEELDYYEMFINNSKIAMEISAILNEFAENYEFNKLPQIVADVHKLENNADKNLHEILNYLIKDFIPPIDREDIVFLTNRMDDTIDYLDEIFINLKTLNVKKLRKEFIIFAQIINKLSILLNSMITKFKNKNCYAEVHNLIIEINETEEKGDTVFENAIEDLFTNETNSVEIIRWNTIYNELENCIDSFENIANAVDEIILKNT